MDIRLQKIIAQAGIASRREAERLIEEGLVTVNGVRVTALGAKADPQKDAVKVRGKLITRREPPVYLVMHKPKNVLTAVRDEGEKGRTTVLDLLPAGRRRVFPIGRLDFDVEGALLLTNDGELAHRLAHPRYQIPRIYDAKVKGRPAEKALIRMVKVGSIPRGKRPPEPAKIRPLETKAAQNTWLRIELREGRYHHVKKMCEAAGHQVIKLVRRSFGGVNVSGLKPGEVRPLNGKELLHLRIITGLAQGEKESTARAGWAKAAPRPERSRKKRAVK
ncbi:MAG: pseudouridine synthase [bacterium]|nr:pseudouridine synthase [bacterium]